MQCTFELKQPQQPTTTTTTTTLQSTSAMVSLTFPKAIITAENTHSSTEASHLHHSNKPVTKSPQTRSFSAAQCPYWNIFSLKRMARQCYRQVRNWVDDQLKNPHCSQSCFLAVLPAHLAGRALLLQTRGYLRR